MSSAFLDFDLAALLRQRGFWYLGTPYRNYAAGLAAAFRDACRLRAFLLRYGVACFSPIAHSHGVAIYGGLDPRDNAIWLPAERPIMRAACGLIVGQLDGWQDSRGLAYEIAYFRDVGRPVMALPPGRAEWASTLQHGRPTDAQGTFSDERMSDG